MAIWEFAIESKEFDTYFIRLSFAFTVKVLQFLYYSATINKNLSEQNKQIKTYSFNFDLRVHHLNIYFLLPCAFRYWEKYGEKGSQKLKASFWIIYNWQVFLSSPWFLITSKVTLLLVGLPRVPHLLFLFPTHGMMQKPFIP